MSGRGHAHDHRHDDHDDQGHSHAHVPRDASSARAIGIAALLTGGFMVVEVAGGLISGSLALIADAGHMLTDFAALGMAWLAFRVARRPADEARTYGFDRLSVMAAFVNGLALFVVAAWIVIEAIGRLRQPEHIAGWTMFMVAVLGLLVNILSFWVLSRGDRGNLNLRAALLHVLGDLLGSAGAIVAALVIVSTGWTPIDPLLSVLVSVLILRAGWRVVRESAHILLEGTPEGFDSAAVAADLAAIPGVVSIRHLHAWSISETRPMVTLEAVVAEEADVDSTRVAIKARLAEHFGFDHATVETCREGAGAGAGHRELPCAAVAHK